MKNTLKCNITGAERVTNVPYLTKKADRLEISVEDYKQFYVSKAALVELKADVAENGIESAAEELGETVEVVTAYINFNGKNKYVPAPAEDTESDETTEEEEEFASGELVSA